MGKRKREGEDLGIKEQIEKKIKERHTKVFPGDIKRKLGLDEWRTAKKTVVKLQKNSAIGLQTNQRFNQGGKG